MSFVWIGSISAIVAVYYSFSSKAISQEIIGVRRELIRDEIKVYDLVNMASQCLLLFALLTLMVGGLGIFCPKCFRAAVWMKGFAILSLIFGY